MLRSLARPIPFGVLVVALASPASAPAQEAAHTVVRGNTLWDLAGTLWQDPWQWPRLWEANRDRVQDPDLIYPGQVLRIPGADGTVREVVVQPALEPEPAPEPQPEPEPAGAREPSVAAAPTRLGAGERGGDALALGRESASARAGTLGGERQAAPTPAPQPAPERAFVTDEMVASAPFLVLEGDDAPAGTRVSAFAGAEEVRAPRSSARLYDRLVLEHSGVAPARGTLLQSYRLDATIPGLGRVARPTGVLVVVDEAGSAAVAEVHVQLDALRLGDLVRPLPAAGLVPGVDPGPVTGGTEARVVGEALPHPLQNVGDFLFLDVGRGTTSVGDEFVPVWPTQPNGPPEGVLRVVAVQEGYATARIVNLVNPVFEPGLIVRMARRMPAR
jgi:hypothetical protein